MGRLQRTAGFLAVTTYGTVADAERAVARVRGVHRRVTGTAADGKAYSAGDPHLLRWVHVAEVDSFLRAHQRYGAEPLEPADCDGYVADMARVATELGVPDPPRSVAELDRTLAAYRPELRGTAEARSAARFVLLSPKLPLPAWPGYAALAAAAVAMLPWRARLALRLPILPVTETVISRPAGAAVTGVLRWAMTADVPAPRPAVR